MSDPEIVYFLAYHPARGTWVSQDGETPVKSSAKLILEADLEPYRQAGYLFDYAGCKREVRVLSRSSHVVISSST